MRSCGIPSSPQAIHSFNEFADLCMSQGLTFPSGVPSTDASRTWFLVSTCHSWFLSQKSWDVNRFFKQSTITLAFSFGWYVISKGPWIVVGAFGPFLFIIHFTIGHRAWGVTSQFPTIVSHHCSTFLRVICLIVLATQFKCYFTYWILGYLPQVSIISAYVLANFPDLVCPY
jgi:hypothetical protein